MGGYMGKMAWIDLTTGVVRVEDLPEEVRRRHIGGAGLAAHVFRQTRFHEIDPLGPENILVFASGPLAGTGVPCSGRYAVAAKSPLTGIWGEADCGGRFGAVLKAAGYDAVAVTGRAAAPSVLTVLDGKIAVVPAADVWGKDTYQTHEVLVARHGPRSSAVCIGPVGERLIPLANIMTEGRHARAAGRCGLGAVMGSKHLKAVVANGGQRVPVERPRELQAAIKALAPGMREKMKRMSDFGTAGGVVGSAAIADLSALNWTDGDIAVAAEAMSGENMVGQHGAGDYACPPCFIGCGKRTKIPAGPHAGEVSAAPEYETVGGFGPQCGIYDWNIVIEANDYCNRMGMDTISVASAVAFVFEAVGKGLIADVPAEPKLEWGSGQGALSLVRQMAEGGGVGALVQGGVRKAVERLGPEAGKFAIQVKGLEAPFHDPRAYASLAIAYATSPRGACHRGCTHNVERVALPGLGYPQPLDRFEQEGKGKASAVLQNYADLFNSLKLCQIAMRVYDVPVLLELLNHVTGWEMGAEELLRAGERNVNVKRLLNISCGLTRADDTLPYRLEHEPFKAGGAAGKVPDLQKMLDEYYQARGWTSGGVPTPEKLEELGLR